MDPQTTIQILQNGLYIILIMSGIIIVPGLMVGLTVAVLQAATQINELSLTFVPKLVATVVVLMLASPWLLSMMLDYTQTLIKNIPSMIG